MCIESGTSGEITQLAPNLQILKCWSDNDKQQIKSKLPDGWVWKKNKYGIWICN